MSVLEVNGLSKQYPGVFALNNVDLTVGEGEVFGFLGPNGAGKTTFTKCVAGFVKPTAGQITIAGIDAIKNPVSAHAHIGLVPDQYEFYPNLTGIQHLDFYGRLHGMLPRDREQRIEELLKLLRMDDRAHRKVKGYSHGMKQRICIAQALLHKPKLIFFDEPTNGLDPQGAYELREMIRGLSRDGTTVFLNSHGLHEVEQVCDRVAILHRGTLRMVGPVSDLKNQASGGVTIRLKKTSAAARSAVRDLGIDHSWVDETLSANIREDDVPNVVAALVRQGAAIMQVTPNNGLEDAFLHLTEGE